MGSRQSAHRLVTAFLNAAACLLGLKRASRWSCRVAQAISPVAEVGLRDGKSLKLLCPNVLTHWRARSFHTKEPETLAWIDGFGQGDTLLDIGANIGLYTLYAAVRGHRVLAIEPESQNYALLNQNIFANALQERASALCVGIGARSHQAVLNLSEEGVGAALHAIADEPDNAARPAKLRQGVIVLSLDDLLGNFTDFFPSHIKIDVDGTEEHIVQGGARTLSDGRLKSVLIELNEDLPADRELVKRVQGHGFRLLQRSHAKVFDSGQYSMIYNYIFGRT